MNGRDISSSWSQKAVGAETPKIPNYVTFAVVRRFVAQQNEV